MLTRYSCTWYNTGKLPKTMDNSGRLTRPVGNQLVEFLQARLLAKDAKRDHCPCWHCVSRRGVLLSVDSLHLDGDVRSAIQSCSTVTRRRYMDSEMEALKQGLRRLLFFFFLSCSQSSLSQWPLLCGVDSPLLKIMVKQFRPFVCGFCKLNGDGIFVVLDSKTHVETFAALLIVVVCLA